MMLLIKFFGLLNRSVKDLLGSLGNLALFIESLQLVDDEMGIGEDTDLMMACPALLKLSKIS